MLFSTTLELWKCIGNALVQFFFTHPLQFTSLKPQRRQKETFCSSELNICLVLIKFGPIYRKVVNRIQLRIEAFLEIEAEFL